MEGAWQKIDQVAQQDKEVQLISRDIKTELGGFTKKVDESSYLTDEDHKGYNLLFSYYVMVLQPCNLRRFRDIKSSSSDHVDSGGPWRQPSVSTTLSRGPFSTNAEGCTIGDLLYPQVARTTWASAGASRGRRKNQYTCAVAACDNARGELVCGRRVSGRGQIVNSASW